jgi:hypothetical protein
MIPLGNQEVMDWEIASMNRFMKRRYPGRRNVPFVVSEVRDWMDMKLKIWGLGRIGIAWLMSGVQMKGGNGLVGRLGGRSGFYRMNQQSLRELRKSFLRSLGQVKGRAKN